MCYKYNDSTAAINMQGYVSDLQHSYISHIIYSTHKFLTALTALIVIHFSQHIQHSYISHTIYSTHTFLTPFTALVVIHFSQHLQHSYISSLSLFSQEWSLAEHKLYKTKENMQSIKNSGLIKVSQIIKTIIITRFITWNLKCWDLRRRKKCHTRVHNLGKTKTTEVKSKSILYKN